MQIFLTFLFLVISIAPGSTLKLDFPQVLTTVGSELSSVSDLMGCLGELKVLASPTNESEAILREMVYIYSGHNVQDLGDYQTCNNFSSLQYTLAIVNLPSSTFDILFGICGPAQCEASDYEAIIEYYNMTKGLPSMLKGASFTFSDPSTFVPTTDTALYVSLAIIGFVVVLNIAGTLISAILRYFGAKRRVRQYNDSEAQAANDSINLSLINNEKMLKIAPKDEKRIFKKICECFDISSNYEDFLKEERGPNHDDNLRVFNGIRVLAFGWVVFGHNAEFMIELAKNFGTVPVFYESVWFLTTYAGLLAVDLFYFMGGFFSGYILIQKAKSMSPSLLNYFKIFFHRLIRIWPSYVICILFYWQILPWLGSGPLWYLKIEYSNFCNGIWWHNMLFIDNWMNTETCYGWGWYLSTDIQIFLIVPLIVWIYDKSKETGRNVLWLLITVSIAAGFYEAINSGFSYSIPVNIPSQTGPDFYYNPIVRASPYLIGAFLGIMYKKYKNGEERNFFNLLEKSLVASLITFLVGVALMIFLVYYPRVLQNGGTPWNNGFATSWIGLNRPLYVFGVFLIVAPVLSGSFGWLKEFLGCGVFNLLAKLTFTMYLVHYQMLEYTYFIDTQAVNFTGPAAYYRVIAVVILSAVAALIVHLLVEKPFSNIEVRILNVKKARRMNSEFEQEKNKIKQDFQDLK